MTEQQKTENAIPPEKNQKDREEEVKQIFESLNVNCDIRTFDVENNGKIDIDEFSRLCYEFNINLIQKDESKNSIIYPKVYFINLMNNIPLKKFHMILDIDSTMIKALDKTEIPDNRKSDDFEISGSVDDKNTFEFFCRYRPYLFHFIHELKDYFHFFLQFL